MAYDNNFSQEPMKPIKLKSGTELPLMNIKGKPYLQVAHRLVWFREEHPDWTIRTKIEGSDMEAGWVVIKAGIMDENDRLIASAHKRETKTGFADYIEKAETGAIGRALAMCGYGTQYEPDMDEGDRLADAPTTRTKKK
ncbi:MAG: hypothetical protein KAJ75_05670 [Alphaproteobacteria bacterium]|nr:hypothetical protein [Alphaproteobacteria bacterium]